MSDSEPGIDFTDEDKLTEKCAIFGAFNTHDSARITYFGLYALQHRGQESSGIASSDQKKIHVHKDLGLVAQVYQEKDFEHLKGNVSIGHNRYSTSGGTLNQHTQPVHNPGDSLALVHNGNLPSTKALEQFLSDKKIKLEGLNDSELIYEAIKFYLGQGMSLAQSVKTAYPLLTGAFALLIMTKDELVGVMDPYGIRPLSVGKLNGGFVFSSETCALDTVNAKFIKELEGGEMAVINKDGIRYEKLDNTGRKFDIFEFVYFSRPDSMHLGKRVYEVRQNFGRILAKEYPVKADIVIPIPESGIPAALGYSEVSKIPFQYALIKNRYIGRTFIMPDQRLRDHGVQMKLNPIPELVRGKKIIIVDDSIVRGTTIGKIVALFREAGAKQVHVMISSPPVKYPDFYGINTPFQKDLTAAFMSVEEIRQKIGADSLNYLSFEGLIKGTGLPENNFNTSMFTGIYPLDIAERAKEVQKV